MDELVTSTSNSTVKRLRKLMRSGKMRRDENTFVAEGIHLASSFLTTGRSPLLYACAQSALQNKEIINLTAALNSNRVPHVTLSDTIFESISSVHASVGILLLFAPPLRDKPKQTILTESAVLLEDIQDPGNLGTILRTAAAAGIKEVALSPGCASPWSPKALRAGMGAQFSLTIYERENLEELIMTAKVPTLATTLAPGSESLYSIDLRRPVAWLFGNEGQGISEPLARHVKIQVSIPQADTSVESLNVAAAVAVCLYEQYRQNDI